MERVIRFRGKRTDNGEWVYGTPVYYQSGEVCIYNDKCPQYGYEATRILSMRNKVLPETVGQFTGLCAGDYAEIFEGDRCIRKNYSSAPNADNEPYTGVIEFDRNHPGFIFKFTDNAGARRFFPLDATVGFEEMAMDERITVIGTIHSPTETSRK